VLSPGKTIVVVAPRWPFDPWIGAPKEIRDLSATGGKIALAVQVLLVWLDLFGFVFIEIALLLGIGRKDQIPPEEIRLETWARIADAFPEKTRVFIVYINSIDWQNRGDRSLIDCGTPLPRQEGSFGKQEENSLKSVPESLNSFIDRGTPLNPISRSFLENPESPEKGVPESLRLPEIKFTGDSWWRRLVHEIRKACPNLPIFEVRLQTQGGLQWTRGLGDMQAAQDFYRALGREIDSNSWREVGNV